MLTATHLAQYRSDGYCVVKELLHPQEVEHFCETARKDLRASATSSDIMQKGDKDGNTTLLKMWYMAGDDLYGLVARDSRLVDMARQIIGDDIYIYSHKMTMKEPHEGGAWEWHQDYGYWHDNKCLAPDMLSIWIALDPSVKANGCLQVLPRSHRLGRLNHIRVDGQTVIDDEYLQAALRRFDRLYVEMDPGDALVFDCNLLHRSDANTDDRPRWGYIVSYNASNNAPFRDVREYGRFEELHPVPSGSFAELSPE
jgi:ectoine hydroxylase-related dioxygenase (phytanoyl-CoA dioxygenase family)